jgi:hypothetical protein
MRIDPRGSLAEQAETPLRVCGDPERIPGVAEMKKTRELIATHYRRSIKRSASPNIPNVDLPLHCPICGARLSVAPVKNSRQEKDPKSAKACSPARKNGTTDSRNTEEGSTLQKPKSSGEG